MQNIQKIKEFYQEIEQLTAEETMQLVLESRSEDEKDFYELIGNYLLQKRQKSAIERNLF